MIIDIHLEVLDECQKGDTKLVQEDFFEILVQEFMGSEFIKQEKVPKDDVLVEQVPSSDFGFREEDFVSKEDVPMEQVSMFDGLKEGIPEEEVPSSDSGFREERLCS
ncbi:SICA antigen [Plasmodium coatneyi]|uniref:SICA antigen n=1 Tax=Plasmodium coatneyi TaxID=208452 RepID=A0A1B1DYJ5_9APIC|nr:SICA antigen [Plasmodium coatneyi]ANQ07689.1 SICA antigen [Plasmodium coatneyi]